MPMIELIQQCVVGRHPGANLLITGGVHGDEFEPMAAVRRLIGLVRPEEMRGKVTLVPVVNEPAFRLGRRTAEDGLDLARTCPGKADGSITEQIAYALSQMIQTADYYIDLHTGGIRLRVQPLVGYTLHPSQPVLENQRRMAKAFRLPIIWGTDPGLNGRTLSVARDAKVPAIYAEYLGGGACNPAAVEAFVHGCLNVMAELRILDRPVLAPLPDAIVVEDERPGSGHMQVNHPSPIEGFFEPLAKLGQWVLRGDALGTVTDVLGQRVDNIKANRTGIVLVLHSFARVDAGDSLGVVLEMPGG